MKKIIALAALSVAAVCTLSTGCSGCNNDNKNVLPLASNWYTDTSYKHIQPPALDENYHEKLVYSVKQTFLDRGANTTYKVEYSEGATYTTEFYATTSDLVPVHPDLNDYPEKAFTVYCYKTVFLGEVKYVFGGEVATFTDNIETECYFASVGENLRPLYSETVIDSPSPSAYASTALEHCYVKFDRTCQTYYNYAGTEAISVMTSRDDGESYEKPVAIGDTLNSVYDVNSLAIVARALSNSSLPQTMNLVTTANGMQEFNINSYADGAYTISDAERAAAGEVLAAAGLYTVVDGSAPETVALSLTSTFSLAGVEPVYWFAKVDNATNNKSRATMVKYVEPLTYGLGYLTYTLKEVKSTFWNA